MLRENAIEGNGMETKRELMQSVEEKWMKERSKSLIRLKDLNVRRRNKIENWKVFEAK